MIVGAASGVFLLALAAVAGSWFAAALGIALLTFVACCVSVIGWD